jgi:hypothetical protein
MSELAKKLFEGLKVAKDGIQAMTPDLKEMGSQVKGELSRLGTQGAMELSSVLFNGQGFVPYGPGQYTPSPEHGQEQQHARQDQGIER